MRWKKCTCMCGFLFHYLVQQRAPLHRQRHRRILCAVLPPELKRPAPQHLALTLPAEHGAVRGGLEGVELNHPHTPRAVHRKVHNRAPLRPRVSAAGAQSRRYQVLEKELNGGHNVSAGLPILQGGGADEVVVLAKGCQTALVHKPAELHANVNVHPLADGPAVLEGLPLDRKGEVLMDALAPHKQLHKVHRIVRRHRVLPSAKEHNECIVHGSVPSLVCGLVLRAVQGSVLRRVPA
mmetsp:Transcript_41463/g.104564  ORF Transcript_41463/g.104564 Transcript_41463/m.104564 type:complete len:237 (+) Transcript_41463:116-826(+)